MSNHGIVVKFELHRHEGVLRAKNNEIIYSGFFCSNEFMNATIPHGSLEI